MPPGTCSWLPLTAPSPSRSQAWHGGMRYRRKCSRRLRSTSVGHLLLTATPRRAGAKGGTLAIRIGEGHSRCVILPRIGAVRVHDDTRRLRRLLRPVEYLDPDTGQSKVAPRARVMFATVSRRGSRWYVSLNVHAPDLHPERRHRPGLAENRARFVGVDRGLAAFAVVAAADGTEVGRYHSPKPLEQGLASLRRRSRAAARTQPGSRNRAMAIRRLARQHARIVNVRQTFLHEVSSQLVRTHDRLCVEDLAVAIF
jgi:putative transposase